MNIRIGNDIRMLVKLLGNKKVDYINIVSMKAYIINTTAQNERAVNRFPIEPMTGMYTPTEHNINCSGYPSYYAFPQRYVATPYCGFGLHPDWDKIYPQCHEHNLTEYLARVKATNKRDVVDIVFPAEAQLFTGEYKIVIVAKIYQPGFSSNNLRTVTMDYENVFTLVNTSSEGTDSAVTLHVGIIDDDADVNDTYAANGQLNKQTGILNVGYNTGGSFDIDLSDEFAWEER